MEKKNNLDPQYNKLLEDILENGTKKQTRNGEVISVFGRQIRHKMSDGFPLLTCKRMPFRLIATELLWFLGGDTNIKYLVDNNCHIWDGDAYKNYTKQVNELIDGYMSGDIIGTQPHIDEMFNNPDDLTLLTQEEFINKIKTDDEFAKKWGELGPIYGKQWRNWKHLENHNFTKITYNKPIDQIANLINDLKTNPDSRRLMVNTWNVGELDQMVLPPCHFSWQCYSHEKDGKRYLSLAWNQRSCDVGLGIPFNIASYGLLLEIIAKSVNMIPYELIGNLGDCHIYSNHIDGVKEQLTRKPYPLPTLKINSGNENWHLLEVDEILNSFDPDLTFKVENYQSHPSIKLPLSN
jgi:thymidylate synthase